MRDSCKQSSRDIICRGLREQTREEVGEVDFADLKLARDTQPVRHPIRGARANGQR